MKRILQSCLSTGAVALAAFLAGAAPPALAQDRTPSPDPTLAALPENTWVKVAGPAPAPAGILAYSGGVFDSDSRRFLIFGGGHADYWGNEVCAFDPATLAWTRMYEPDAQARYTSDNIDNLHGKLRDSARPYTRHSYNQMCFVPGRGMFLFGGCGPGWAGIRPNCPVPPDVWTYSFSSNAWTELYAGKGTPGGYAMACCYDSKRGKVWAYGHENRLSSFDFESKVWSEAAVKTDLGFVGTYNFHMLYLPQSDRILLLGKDACTIDPDALVAERRPLEHSSGKGGLAYMPGRDQVAWTLLTAEKKYRAAVYDCRSSAWIPWETLNLPAGARERGSEADGGEGNVWSRLQYDAGQGVLLLVVADGVWAIRPPPLPTAPK